MRVGALYAVLRLEKGQFEAALATSKTKFGMFANFLKASGIIAAQALAVVVGGSIAAAATFEQHMNQSLAIMGNVSSSVRKQMEDAARAVAKTSTFSANQAADAYYFLASAGFTAKQSIEALPVVTQFAQAGVMDLERATELLMDAQTTMGLRTNDATQNMENMARVSDVLSAAQIHSNATLEQMAQAVTNKAGPAARVLGKDIEEVAAALMVMANRGIKGREAGTQLAIVLRELQTKAIKNKDAFKDMGVAVFDAQGEMRGLPEILGDMEDAFKGMSDEERKEALMMLGFTDRSVGFIQALLGTSDQMAAFEKRLRHAGGATKEVAEKQLDTLINQLIILWHKIVDVGISIGQKLLPGITDAVRAIGNWIEENHKLIADVVIALVDGIGRLIGAFIKMVAFIGPVLGPILALIWDLLIKGAEAVAGFLENLGNAGESGGAFEMIADAVATLSDAFNYIADDVIPAVVEAIGPFITEAFETLGDLITWFIEEILPGLIAVFSDIAATAVPMIGDVLKWLGEEVIPPLAEAFTWLAEEVLPVVLEAIGAVVDFVVQNWPVISDIVVTGAHLIAKVVTVAWNVIQAVISTVVPIIWAIIEPIGRLLFPAIGAAAHVLLEAIRITFHLIEVIWDAVGDAAHELVADVIQAWNFLSMMTGAIWDGIVSIIKGGVNAIIWAINLMIGGLNALHFDFPSFTVPGLNYTIGGGSFDPFNIPTIPYLARGTKRFAGGLAVVGEQGPELVNLPKGAEVISNSRLRDMMREQGGGEGAHIERHAHIHIMGEQPKIKTAEDAVKMWDRLAFLDG